VEVAACIGRHLGAVVGHSGLSWHAKHNKGKFNSLRQLDTLLGEDWDVQHMQNRRNENVKLYVHEALLNAVEVKYDAGRQASIAVAAIPY
jgi:hypothetical protein